MKEGKQHTEIWPRETKAGSGVRSGWAPLWPPPSFAGANPPGGLFPTPTVARPGLSGREPRRRPRVSLSAACLPAPPSLLPPHPRGGLMSRTGRAGPGGLGYKGRCAHLARRYEPPRPAMANSGLQLLGFALALLGWIATLAATVMPQWQMSSYAGDNIITAVAIYQGLWMSCAWQSTGQIQCKVYDSVLALKPALQATRALMVVSIVLGVVGMGIATMGMKCTRCGGDNKVTKARIAMTGGIIFLVSGLASLVACSWYGNQIVQDFYNPTTPVNSKYEFGAAVFIGWAGAALLVLGGALLSCSCPGKSGQSSYGRQYPQGKPISKPPSNREYV